MRIYLTIERINYGKGLSFITIGPDLMWGTDMTTTVTTEEGNASVFVAIDHYSCECVGIHASRRGTRFEALEPIR